MKIDLIKSLIAIVISTLLAYACYCICKSDSVQWVITVGAGLTIAIPMMFAIGVSAKAERTAVMLHVLSWVVTLIEVLVNGIFLCFNFCTPTYIIVNGLILTLYVLIYISIYRKQM